MSASSACMLARTLAAAAATVCAFSSMANADRDASPPVIELNQGPVQGVPSADGETVSYKGLPFAAPPVDDLRWREPQPPKAWNDLLVADSFSADCEQVRPSPDSWNYREGARFSEDCLYLNVFAPASAAEQDARLPVMVWIYGGTFVAGGASQPAYDTDRYAREGVILVTFNYRVGSFGYLAHPALRADSPNATSGNYGTLDQVAALEWVEQNIERFGGNPDNVSVFGESAGAISINALMATPRAHHLFDKAIIQSGGLWGLTPFMRGLEEVEAFGKQFAAGRGAETAEEMRALPAEDILSLTEAEAASIFLPFQPIADGSVTPRTTAETFYRSLQAQKPVLLGWTRDEQGYLIEPGQTREDQRELFENKLFGDRAERMMELYPVDEGQDARSAMVSAWTNAIGEGMLVEAGLHADAGNDVYLYRFDEVPPGEWAKTHGAVHGSDVPYTFDYDRGGLWDAGDRAASDALVAYWVNFAKTGDPNTGSLAEWRLFDGNEPGHLRIDATPEYGPIADIEVIRNTRKSSDAEGSRAAE